MYNMYPLLVKLQDRADAEKFAGVLRESLNIHTALSYVTDGERQHYVSDLYNITIEHMSEDDFMTLKDNLIQPFELRGKALCRFRIIETERAKYFFSDNHHIAYDGFSIAIFWHTLDRLYRSKKIFPDYWPQYLAEYETITKSSAYDECRKWYEERYSPVNYSTYPLPDFPEGQYPNAQGIIRRKLDIDAGRIQTSRYTFFNAASLLAAAAYNNTPDVMLTWTDNNRQDKKLIHTAGMMMRDLPLAVRLEGMTAGGIAQERK